MTSPISPKVPTDVPGINYLRQVPSEVKAKILAMSGLRGLTGAMVLDKMWDMVAKRPNIWTSIAKELGISLSSEERVDTKNAKLDAPKNEELFKGKVNDFLMVRAMNEAALKYLPPDIAKSLQEKSTDPYILRDKIGDFIVLRVGQDYTPWSRLQYPNLKYFFELLKSKNAFDNEVCLLFYQKVRVLVNLNLERFNDCNLIKLPTLQWKDQIVNLVEEIYNLEKEVPRSSFQLRILLALSSCLVSENLPSYEREIFKNAALRLLKTEPKYSLKALANIYILSYPNNDLEDKFVTSLILMDNVRRDLIRSEPEEFIQFIKKIFILCRPSIQDDIINLFKREFQTDWIKSVPVDIFHKLNQIFESFSNKAFDLEKIREECLEELNNDVLVQNSADAKSNGDVKEADASSKVAINHIVERSDEKLKDAYYILDDSPKLARLLNAVSKTSSSASAQRIKLEKELYKDKRFSKDKELLRWILELNPNLFREIKPNEIVWRYKYISTKDIVVEEAGKVSYDVFHRIDTLYKYQLELKRKDSPPNELKEIVKYIDIEIAYLKMGLVAKIDVQLAMTLENAIASKDQKAFNAFHTKAITLLNDRNKIIVKLKTISPENDAGIADWEKQSAGIKKQIERLTFKEVKSAAKSKEEATAQQPIASTESAAGLPPAGSGGAHKKEMDSKHKQSEPEGKEKKK